MEEKKCWVEHVYFGWVELYHTFFVTKVSEFSEARPFSYLELVNDSSDFQWSYLRQAPAKIKKASRICQRDLQLCVSVRYSSTQYSWIMDCPERSTRQSSMRIKQKRRLEEISSPVFNLPR